MNRSDYIRRYFKYSRERYSPLYVQGRLVGRVAHHLEGVLAHISGGAVTRRDGGWWMLGGDEELDLISNRLAEGKFIPALTGERYRVLDLVTGSAVGSIDRSAAIWLGLRTEGVHLNVFVPHHDGSMDMWLARRALTHRQFPGQLDNLVAGGLGVGYSWDTALRDEAADEAGISAAMLDAVHHAGTLTYCFDTEDGLVESEIQVCDLEVSPLFVPQNRDGKVDSFLLVSLREAERLALEADSFKFNCGLVVLDFVDRHCVLDSQDELKVLRTRRNASWTSEAFTIDSVEAKERYRGV